MTDQETTFGTGQLLFKQGDKGGDLYFVKSGQVELTVRSETGETAVVAVLGERSVIGTMSFLEGEARSATAKCLTEVKAVVVKQAVRERLLATIPKWFFVVVKDLSGNLRKLDEKYANLLAENETLKKRVEFMKRKLKDQGASEE
jgi:CRP/FNR family cyclic AMP-dependent transcriptional regulator